MRRPITQEGIARMLKLDRSSVSLALRGSPRVSEETRQRVLALAARYNYRPNLAAQQLRASRPKVIGLLLSGHLGSLAEPVVVATLQAMAHEVASVGLVMSILAAPASEAATVSLSISAHLDGLLVWGDVPAAIPQQYAPSGCAVLVVDPNDPSYMATTLSAVRMDNAGGAAAVVEHLVERGAERLLFIKCSDRHLGHVERWNGAREAWVRHRPVVAASCCAPGDVADADLVTLAREGGGAVFCSHDGVAFDIWLRLTRLGIKVPDEVRLAGFDGTPLAARIGLTTAAPDCEAIARAAVQGIMALMTDRAEAASAPPVAVHLHIGVTT